MPRGLQIRSQLLDRLRLEFSGLDHDGGLVAPSESEGWQRASA